MQPELGKHYVVRGLTRDDECLAVVEVVGRLHDAWRVRTPEGRERLLSAAYFLSEIRQEGLEVVLGPGLTEEQQLVALEVIGDLFEATGAKGGLKVEGEMDSESGAWEPVAETAGWESELGRHERVDRLKVPGGWLYRVVLGNTDEDGPVSMTTTFVPAGKDA